MWTNRSRCFVRVWHHPRPVEGTGRPILFVTYRFALEQFYPFTDYSLFHYDGKSRAGVRSVSLVSNQLRIVLKKDPLMDAGRQRILAFAEAQKLPGGVLVLTFGLVSSLSPEDDGRYQFDFQGRLYPWLQEVGFPSDYKSALGDRLLTARFSQQASEFIGDFDSDFD